MVGVEIGELGCGKVVFYDVVDCHPLFIETDAVMITTVTEIVNVTASVTEIGTGTGTAVETTEIAIERGIAGSFIIFGH